MRLQLLSGVAAGVLATLAFAGVASAQITKVTVDQSANGDTYDQTNLNSHSYSFNTSGANQNVQLNTGASVQSYLNYQVVSQIANGQIEFANNVTTLGAFSHINTMTSVTIDYTNNTLATINPTLTSTITPAGFGFYTASTGNNPSNINAAPESTTGNFISQNGYQPPGLLTLNGHNQMASLIGQVSVSYQILSGGAPIEDFEASLSLFQTFSDPMAFPTGVTTVLTMSSLTGAMLNNFGLIAADDPLKAVGYRWGATDVTASLGALAPGASNSLSYITTVTGFTYDAAGSMDQNILGYAGFGDPIGGNGGANGVNDPDFPLLNLSLPTFNSDGTFTPSTFLGYSDPLPLQILGAGGVPTGDPITLSVPDRLRGVLGVEPQVAGVPEPMTWALMLVGFGGIGVAVRRRRALPA
jgi:hypothetical protein